MSHANGQVAHIWAHQSKNEARSNNGNFWFEGKIIYSYRTPIAVLHDTCDGRVALVSSDTYSVTTSGKHMPAINRATDYGSYIKDFRVPSIGATGGWNHGSAAVDHVKNVEYLQRQYDDTKARLIRKRDLWESMDASLLRPLDMLNDYCAAFELERPLNVLSNDIAAIEKIRNERAEKAASPAAVAKREKARAAKEERERIAALKEFEKQKQQRAEWLAGTIHHAYNLRTETGGPLLRVRGDNLETSQGAEVPLSHAIKAFRFVKLVKESGQAWQRNGKTVRVGHFQVDAIDTNGNMHAGCHHIEWAEIERLAKEIGVFDETASAEAVETTAH